MCCVQLISCVWLYNCMDYSLPASSAHGIFQQEYRSGLPFPLPGDIPNPGIEPTAPALAGRFFTTVPPEMPHWTYVRNQKSLMYRLSLSIYQQEQVCVKFKIFLLGHENKMKNSSKPVFKIFLKITNTVRNQNPVSQ